MKIFVKISLHNYFIQNITSKFKKKKKNQIKTSKKHYKKLISYYSEIFVKKQTKYKINMILY